MHRLYMFPERQISRTDLEQNKLLVLPISFSLWQIQKVGEEWFALVIHKNSCKQLAQGDPQGQIDGGIKAVPFFFFMLVVWILLDKRNLSLKQKCNLSKNLKTSSLPSAP